MNFRQIRSVLTLLFVCVGCVEPYAPLLNMDDVDALVVDGNIDVNGTASVKLSRALPLASFAENPAERGATVSIRSSAGETFPLTEGENAIYRASNLPVNYKTKYVLQIKTAGGSEYESDEIQVHSTPPVGRIYATYDDTRQNIEVRTDSRDVSPDATGYYLFDCIETFEYRAHFFSKWKRVNGLPVQRKKGEFVDTCWQTLPVPVTIKSTNRLSENYISGHLLTSISKFSPKMSMRYSMMVRQRSVSEQEFNYRTQLFKTINEQGSIFAEIPGPVVGNVHSKTDKFETVLGFFRGQEMKERRFFLERFEIPPEYQADPLEDGFCDLEATCPTNVPVNGPSICIDIGLLSETKIIITTEEVKNSVVYYFAPKECGDCRERGGTTTTPIFW